MKPYFTKWIPDPKGTTLLYDSYIDGVKTGKLVVAKDPSEQLIADCVARKWNHFYGKLFLCSRDIKVGDKDIHTGVMQDYGEEIVKEVKYEHQLEFMKGVSEANKTELFKIIGEVSPQAIWIKEGMEIETRDCHLVVNSDGSEFWKINCPTCGDVH